MASQAHYEDSFLQNYGVDFRYQLGKLQGLSETEKGICRSIYQDVSDKRPPNFKPDIIPSAAGKFRTHLPLNNLRGIVGSVPSLEKNPDFFARFESIWSWTCGKVTNHEITWRWGKCLMCKECANIVVEKL